MTKLEEKLIELGYEYKPFMFDPDRTYIKYMNRCKIVIDTRDGRVKGRYIQHTIFYQQDIDNLQQAFNVMQKDLEELKKYER